MTQDTEVPRTDAPKAPKRGDASALSPKELLGFVWTQLTSMKTALTLLFVAALAAIPGGLIPQRTVSPVQVSEFITNNPTLGPIYDAIGLF
ncbi:MAG: cytochrome c biogenesis protein ResB, partial [Propionibacteriaceae bacterium]|nr:cytochrome c biogenesis protein ResB [Propionibacteriaceae bacterium]